MSGQVAGQLFSTRIAGIAAAVLMWTATAVAVEFAPFGSPSSCPCPPLDDVGADWGVVCDADWGAMCGVAISASQRCDWRPSEPVVEAADAVSTGVDAAYLSTIDAANREDFVAAQCAIGGDLDFNYYGGYGGDDISGAELLAVRAAIGGLEALVRVWADGAGGDASSDTSDEGVVVGSLSELLADTSWSDGLATVDQLNRDNESAPRASSPAAIVRQQPTYTWYSFHRSAWDTSGGLVYEESELDSPVRLEAEGAYASKPRMRIGTAGDEPLEAFEAIIDGEDRYLFLRKTEAESREAVHAPTMIEGKGGEEVAPGKEPSNDGRDVDAIGKRLAAAGSASGVWIEPTTGLALATEPSDGDCFRWYDEVMGAAAASAGQTVQSADAESVPSNGQAARLMARTAAGLAAWAGSTMQVVASRLEALGEADGDAAESTGGASIGRWRRGGHLRSR